jgi:hypothetical protein
MGGAGGGRGVDFVKSFQSQHEEKQSNQGTNKQDQQLQYTCPSPSSPTDPFSKFIIEYQVAATEDLDYLPCDRNRRNDEILSFL